MMKHFDKREYDAFCFGATNCDLLFGGLERLPAPGREEFCQTFKMQAGGAANTAMALSRLGVRTAFYTRLGEDKLGDAAYASMEGTGLAMEYVVRDPAIMTSVTAVLSLGHERAFATYDKTGMECVPKDVLEQGLLKSTHVHSYLGYAKSLGLDSLKRKYGCTLSLDTGWDPSQSIEDYKEVLSACDVFLPNAWEVLQLTGETELETAISSLAAYCRLLVVKLGDKGCALCHNGQVQMIPGRAVQAVDTCGAGDLFNAGFLKGYLSGMPLNECARLGNASGALSVTFLGGMDDMYTLENVKRMMP